jgi:hypothetical protein
LSFNVRYFSPFEELKPKEKSTIEKITYNKDGFLWKDFDNKFKAKLLHTAEEMITCSNMSVSAWHEPSQKLIDLPNPISLKLLFDTNPLTDVTESEAVYLLGEIGRLKKLEGEWTNGLVKPPRRAPSMASMMRDYLGNDLIREEVQRSLSSGSGIMSNLPREEWTGGSLQIPVQPIPTDLYGNPHDAARLEAQRRAIRERREQAAIAAQRMARPIINIEYPSVDDEPYWSRF